LVGNLFGAADRKKPAVILIKEIESLTELDNGYDPNLKREIRTQIQFNLALMQPGVFLIGTTSHPWLLDKIVSNCFERHITIQQPTKKERRDFFLRAEREVPSDLSLEDIDELGSISEGYMFGDLELVVQDALLQPMKRLANAKSFKEVCHHSF
jgi:vacuolar protein-sorting-associated protein 4